MLLVKQHILAKWVYSAIEINHQLIVRWWEKSQEIILKVTKLAFDTDIELQKFHKSIT